MSGKIFDTPAAALDGLLVDGMTIMSGGFGLSGNPESLIPDEKLPPHPVRHRLWSLAVPGRHRIVDTDPRPCGNPERCAGIERGH
ncbi:MAG: hypothetical protein EOP89_16015, partial [Lysobacteraceae bacterium]